MTEQQTLSDMRNNVVAWPRKDRGFVAMREKSALALAGLSLLLAAWTSRPVSVCCSIAPTLHGVVSLGGRRYAGGQCVTGNIVHVTFRKQAEQRASLIVEPQPPISNGSACAKSDSARTMELRSSSLRITVDRPSGRIVFARPDGGEILSERSTGRNMEPATVMGEKTSHIHQQWIQHEDE